MGNVSSRELAPPSLSAGQTESDYADILHGMGVALAFQGQPKRARPYFQQAHEIFEAIEHYGMVAYVCGCELAWILLPYFPEDHEGRRRLAAQAEDGVRRSSGTIRGVPARYRALGHLVLQGDWHEARAIATAIAAIPLWLSQLDGALWLVPLAYWQGDVELARRWVAEILPDGPATEVGTSYHVAPALQLQRVSVGMALDAHDLPTARAWLEANGRWLDWSGAVLGRAEGALLWAQYHHANGDLDPVPSARPSRRLPTPPTRVSRWRSSPFTGSSVSSTLRLRQFDGGRKASRRRHSNLAEACRAPFERALTLLEIARLRMAQGNPDEARSFLAEVRSVCEPLGAEADAGEGGGAGQAVDGRRRQMMPESPYVFVSYASADRDRVLPVVALLEQAGVRVWIDREGIHGGANYAKVISDAIRDAAALVLMASPASLASRNVKQELALGWRFEQPYLPLWLDPVDIPDDLAYWLEASQWIEVLDRPEHEWLSEFGRSAVAAWHHH